MFLAGGGGGGYTAGGEQVLRYLKYVSSVNRSNFVDQDKVLIMVKSTLKYSTFPKCDS